MQVSRTAFGKREAQPRADAPCGAARPSRSKFPLLATLAVGAVFLLFLWLPTPGPTPVTPSGDQSSIAEAEREIAAFPNTTIDYYEIDATDPEAIRAQMRERGPRDGRRSWGGYTRWEYRWGWKSAPDGGCGAAQAEVQFAAHVTLPRLANLNSLDPAVAEHWRSYVTALTRHEAGHVRIASERHNAVTNAVRSSTCDTANAAGRQVTDSIRVDQQRYDEATDHGGRQGAYFRA